jgi:hypothetical protein
MRSKVRAYSHQGHGPRADQQAGYISATSDGTPSVAKSSRSIHFGAAGVQHVMVHPVNRDIDDWDEVIEGVGRVAARAI